MKKLLLFPFALALLALSLAASEPDPGQICIYVGRMLEQGHYSKRKLDDDARVLCASPDYLERRGTPRAPNDLASHDCLLFTADQPGGTWRFRCAPKDDALTTLEVSGRLTVGNTLSLREAALALRMLDSQAVSCDFCFLDPPYRKMGDYEQVLGFLSQSQIIRPESMVIAEHDKHFDPGNEFGALRRHRTLRQGDAVLSFYRR